MPIPVSFNVLEAVLAPICEPPEPDYSALALVDGHQEHEVRGVFRKFVKPYFDSFDDKSKKIIGESVLYFARGNYSIPDSFLDSLPVPFDLPTDIRAISSWLAEELDIQALSPDFTNVEYINELNLVHSLRRVSR